jgi:hypothetical protein
VLDCKRTRIPVLALQRAALALLAFAALASSPRAGNSQNAIVTLAAKFSDGVTEWGTGAFVDRDGLILTADHVVHRALASPLSTITAGSVPAAMAPVSITVYGAHLGSPLTVNVTVPGNIVGGNYSGSQWMDAAFVRAQLTDLQRALIQPLDISLSPPGQGEPLTAWGPHCTDITDAGCNPVSAVDAVSVTLSSDPNVNRDYQIRANLNLGFSGGPLINAAGMIVGIASWGLRPNGSPTTGDQIVTATYLPGPLIQKFLSPKIASSIWLLAPAGCSNTADARPLTAIDTAEMFPSDPAPGDCNCCCSSLSRSANSFNTRVGNSSCAQQSNCLRPAAFTLANSVQLAANTGTVDSKTESDYARLRTIVAGPDAAHLPDAERAGLFDSFGATGLAITRSQAAKQFPSLGGAGQDALVAYRIRTKIADTAEAYDNVAELLKEKGKTNEAAAASAIATIMEKPSIEKSATGTIDSKIVNNTIKKLKSQIFAGVPSSVGK